MYIITSEENINFDVGVWRILKYVSLYSSLSEHTHLATHLFIRINWLIINHTLLKSELILQKKDKLEFALLSQLYPGHRGRIKHPEKVVSTFTVFRFWVLLSPVLMPFRRHHIRPITRVCTKVTVANFKPLKLKWYNDAKKKGRFGYLLCYPS